MRHIFLTITWCLVSSVVVGCTDTTDTVTTDDSAKPVAPSGTVLNADESTGKSVNSTKPADNAVQIQSVPLGFIAPVVEGELTIANPAPKPSLSKVVHGKPFEGFENGKIYVVEFWATWCRPCLAGMPHISELADKYRDQVQFVGVTQEDTETVEMFLARKQSADSTWGDVVTYSLATDDNGKTSLAFMDAAGQEGIPTAFIVGRDGVVEWIGYPAAMDDVLAAVVENRFDRKGSYEAVAVELAEKRVRQEAEKKINEAVQKKDYKAAITEVDKLLKGNPEELNLSIIKMDLLRRGNMTEDLNALQAQLVKQRWDEPKFLELIAWGIADENTGTDLDLAMKSARRASALTKDADPSILDTVARVFYAQKNFKEAVNWQKKSVASTGNKGAGTDLGKTLKKYEDELAKESEPKEPAADKDSSAKDDAAADKNPEDDKSDDTPEEGPTEEASVETESSE